MTFGEKAEKLRRKLRFYTKSSLLNELLSRLHAPEKGIKDRAGKMPWLCFLLIEWTFQIEESKHAKNASAREVYNLLNSLYQLQSDACHLSNPIDVELSIRPLLINQLWCQRANVTHIYTLIRIFTITMETGNAEAFRRNFCKCTDVDLIDFHMVSLLLLTFFHEGRQVAKYEDIIRFLCPSYRVEEIAKILKLIGGNISRLEETLLEHKQKKIGRDAYFEDTKLLNLPVIFFDGGISIFHDSVFCRAIGEFALRRLKEEDVQKFQRHFTPAFEEYVATVIQEADKTVLREKQIEEIYKQHSLEGKVVDFFFEEDDGYVFVEAKGIEPHAKVLVSKDSQTIKSKLKSTFMGAIEQAYACTANLIECGKICVDESRECSAIIVSLQDFYLSEGGSFKELIASNFFVKMETKYGQVIKPQNVHFMSIEDFEGVMMVCKENSVTLSHFLQFCREQDSESKTRKFDTRQHVFEFTQTINGRGTNPIGTKCLIENKTKLFNQLKEISSKNLSYWRTKGIDGGLEFITRCNALKSQLV